VKSPWTDYLNDLLTSPPPQKRLHRIGPIGEYLELSEDPPHQVGGGESDSDVEEQQGPWD